MIVVKKVKSVYELFYLTKLEISKVQLGYQSSW